MCLQLLLIHYFLSYLKEKSVKARTSASRNTDPTRLGRTGHAGLKDNWRTKWDQLVQNNSHLQSIQDERSKIWIVSRSRCWIYILKNHYEMTLLITYDPKGSHRSNLHQ